MNGSTKGEYSKMEKWKIILAVFFTAFILFLIGDNSNDVLEIHNQGATMGLANIGLE